MSALEQQTLALAGMFQAAELVYDLANTGSCNQAAQQASIHSLFCFDAQTTEAVFGGNAGLISGLKLLQNHLSDGKKNKDISRYFIQLVQLIKPLMNNHQMLHQIASELEKIKLEFSPDSYLSSPCQHAIAVCYSDSISKLQPRIMVTGDRDELANPAVANQIRAALLAGIRAGVLWRQLDGNQWKLIWHRRKYAQFASQILRSLYS